MPPEEVERFDYELTKPLEGEPKKKKKVAPAAVADEMDSFTAMMALQAATEK